MRNWMIPVFWMASKVMMIDACWSWSGDRNLGLGVDGGMIDVCLKERLLYNHDAELVNDRSCILF